MMVGIGLEIIISVDMINFQNFLSDILGNVVVLKEINHIRAHVSRQ